MRAGQQLSGVSVRLAGGAARSFRVASTRRRLCAASLLAVARHLVPAERESADDILRYFEATPDGSGAFNFKSLPPGRYLVVAAPRARAHA